MTTTTKIVASSILILLIVGLGYYFGYYGYEKNAPLGCTMEAKLCPDGSYVGRSGPQCEFTLCPSPVPVPEPSPIPTPTPIPKPIPKPLPTTSGITGIVLLGPTCPVMRDPPDPQCADKLYQTSLVVSTIDGVEVVASFSSDSGGKFKVNVWPGQYTVRSAAAAPMYPYCSINETIKVTPNTYTTTTIYCDTGIR